MNPLDLPAAPPEHGDVLTLSEIAAHLIPTFKDKVRDDTELAFRIQVAINILLSQGLLREWGFDDYGRTVYASDKAFDFDTRPVIDIPLPPQTMGQVFYIRWYKQED